MNRVSVKKNILVIGGGIAGATVSLRLSQTGMKVHLVEKEASIGGHAAQMGCKAANVCLKCNVCVANQTLRTVSANPNIEVYTRSELTELKTGEKNSRYTAVIAKGAEIIDTEKCIGCGVCVEVCPEKSITIPNPSISSKAAVVDESAWLSASDKQRTRCAQLCPVGAIDLNAEATTEVIDVDYVIMAAGFEAYDPVENSAYNYGLCDNVITGIEAEKQLAQKQKITRPSDGKVPTRVGFVQCVGSRSEEVYRNCEETNYCSAVCCAYALRIAQRMRYQAEESEITVFYMDIQNFGKGFDDFYGQCKDMMRFVRSRPYEVEQSENDGVKLKYTDPSGGGVCQEEFDLLILSVGIRPGKGDLIDKLKVPTDEFGFAGLKGTAAIADTQHEGIFVVGAAESAKDIAGSISQAEAVSAAIISEG